MLTGTLQRIAVTFALCAPCAYALAQSRTWTDAMGKFSVEAVLVEIGSENVKLKNADGKIITVPVSRLSTADRQFLIEYNTRTAAAELPFTTTLTIRRLVPRYEFRNHPQSYEAMYATLEVHGSSIRGITEYGHVRVESARDNLGQELKLLVAVDDAEWGSELRDLRDDSHERRFSSSEEPLAMKLLLSEPTWGATHVESITGSLRLKYRDLDSVTIDNVLDSVGSTLNDPSLKQAARISINRAPEEKVDDIEKTLLVEVYRRNRDVVALDLLDGEGERLSVNQFSFTFGKKTRWGFEDEEKLPADTKLQITLGSRPKTRVVPFHFENLPLGPGGSVRRLQEPQQGRSNSVFVYAPDGRTIAGGTHAQTDRKTRDVSVPGQVLLWDAGTGRGTKRLGTHDWTVDCLAFSSDGKALASANASAKDFHVTVRDAQSGHYKSAREALASAKDCTVKVWDLESGELTQTITLPNTIARVHHLALSPDSGHVIVVGRRHSTEGMPVVYEGGVWDVASAKPLWTLPESNEAAIALSPDGRTLAVFTAEHDKNRGSSRKLKLYDTLTGQSQVTSDAASQTIRRMVFVSEGRNLVGLGDNSVTFWEIPSGGLVRQVQLGSERRWHGAWAMSSDGRRMAWCDSRGQEVELWDMAAGHPLGQLTFDSDDDLDRVAFAPDLNSLVCRRDYVPIIMAIANLDTILPATDSDVIAALRKLGSVDRDNNDVVAELYVRRMDNSAFAHIQRLSGLRELSFAASAEVTDTQLSCLKRLVGLKSLSVKGKSFTDAGLIHLRKLVELKNLTLEGPQITDAVLSHLGGLTKLESLEMNGTQVTDAGLERLAKLSSLEELELMDTRVTDEGVRVFMEAHSGDITILR